MLTVTGFTLFSEEKCCEAVILNVGGFGTAYTEPVKLPLSHKTHCESITTF